MQIGIFVGQLDQETLDDDLRAWSKANISVIECDYAPLLENPMRVLNGFADAFKTADIHFWSVHAPFGGKHNLSHPEKRVRRYAVEAHKFILERTVAVGANILVIHPASASSELSHRKLWDNLRASLDELLPVAEELNITLAVENMLSDEPIGSDPAELNRFLASFLSPNLRLCFDTGHAHIVGNAHLLLESVYENVATYHIADNDKVRDLHLQPGYGTVPWDLLNPILQRTDYPLIVEAYRWQNVSWKRFCEEVVAVLTDQIVMTEVDSRKVTTRCCRCGHLVIRTVDSSISCVCSP